MKKIVGLLIGFILLSVGVVWADSRQDKVSVLVFPVTTTYEAVVDSSTGLTSYENRGYVPNSTQMGYSGTSTCQVIEIGKMAIDGYFTFQFVSIGGSTTYAIGGTTVSAHYKTSNIDSEPAWDAATQYNISGVSALNSSSGATNIAYGMGTLSGTTPLRAQYLRVEFESGISLEVDGLSGITPIGKLFIR